MAMAMAVGVVVTEMSVVGDKVGGVLNEEFSVQAY